MKPKGPRKGLIEDKRFTNPPSPQSFLAYIQKLILNDPWKFEDTRDYPGQAAGADPREGLPRPDLFWPRLGDRRVPLTPAQRAVVRKRLSEAYQNKWRNTTRSRGGP